MWLQSSKKSKTKLESYIHMFYTIAPPLSSDRTFFIFRSFLFVLFLERFSRISFQMRIFRSIADYVETLSSSVRHVALKNIFFMYSFTVRTSFICHSVAEKSKRNIYRDEIISFNETYSFRVSNEIRDHVYASKQNECHSLSGE